MKRFLKSAAAFLFVCMLGIITGLAGGVEWGTLEAGCITFVTLFVAMAAGLTVADDL